MPLECSREELFGGGEIAPFTEPELDGVTDVVDGTVKVHPSAANFDVRLIDMPFSADGPLAEVETFEQFGRIADDPSVNCRMIDRDASLSHHFFEVPQAQPISWVSDLAALHDDAGIVISGDDTISILRIASFHFRAKPRNRD